MKKFSIFILMIAMMFCVSCTNDAPLVKGERTDEVGEEIQNNVGDVNQPPLLKGEEPTEMVEGFNDVPQNQSTTTTLTNYDNSKLSNKKYGWYFNKGTNH